MSDLPILGVDTAHPQTGMDVASLQGAFVIANASRANVGLAVGSDYARQVDDARRLGKETGHYFFNGNHDPVQCADFFVTHLHDFRHGDVLALDVENEPSTSTVAWSPPKVLAFAKRVKQLTGVTVGVYLNESEMNGADWSEVVAFGCWLWLAFPGHSKLPPIKHWSHASIWQYGFQTIGNKSVDADRAFSKLVDLAGDGVAPKSKEFTMPALIRNSDGSIGYVSDQGMLDAISDLNEVSALQATGLVGAFVQMPNPQVWQLLTNRTARLRSAASGLSPQALAAQTAAIVVPAVIAALGSHTTLTPSEIEETSRTTIENLLTNAPVETPTEQRLHMDDPDAPPPSERRHQRATS
jgi:lysozyme